MHWFKVPSGIGDISWIYSKLVNFKKPFGIKVCGEGLRRSLPFVELLPRVVACAYEDFSYFSIFRVQKLGLDAAVRLDDLPAGEYFLSANGHLEAGHKLADFLPDLPTSYHYEFKSLSAFHRIYRFDSTYAIGVYSSKYKNYMNDFKFWTKDEWVLFLRSVSEMLNGDCTFVFIGAPFDADLGNDIEADVRAFAPTLNLIGQTHIGDVINLMYQLDYLFSYPSGIGILADVVELPAMHFIPATRLHGLVDTYADPDNIRSGQHINTTFCPTRQALTIFQAHGLPFINCYGGTKC